MPPSSLPTRVCCKVLQKKNTWCLVCIAENGLRICKAANWETVQLCLIAEKHFVSKKIILDLTVASTWQMLLLYPIMQRQRVCPKSKHDVDSINHTYDSISRSYLQEYNVRYYNLARLNNKADSLKAIKEGDKVNFDTIYNKLPSDRKLIVTNDALSTVQQELSDLTSSR